MLQLFGIFMLIIIYILNRNILKENYKLFNPISSTVIIWSMVLVIHSFYFKNEDYTIVAYSMVLGGILFLAIGFWCFANKTIVMGKTYRLRKPIGYNESGLFTLIKFTLFVEVIRVVYIIYIIIYKLAGSWSVFLHSGTYVRNMYLAYSGGTLANIFEFITNATAFVGYVVVGIFFANKHKYSKNIVIIFTVLEVVYALVTMSKMCLIIYIIVIGTSYLNNLQKLRDQKRVLRIAAPFLILAIFAFLMIIASQRNYMAMGNDLRSTVLKKAAIYFSGPVEALGVYVRDNKSELSMGAKTFVVFGRILQRLGIVRGKSLLEHGVNIDIGYDTINAYSWFKTFYQDFSYVGILVVPFFLGILGGMIYNTKEKSLFYDVCGSWVTAIFAMSFYTYMWGQTVYCFVIVYAFLLNRILRRKIYVYPS